MPVYFKPLLHRLLTKSAERGGFPEKQIPRPVQNAWDCPQAAHDKLRQQVIHMPKWQKPDTLQLNNSANTEKQDH